MTTNEDDRPLIDATITGFGGIGVTVSPSMETPADGGIPEFLRRAPSADASGHVEHDQGSNQPAAATDTHAVAGVAEGGPGPDGGSSEAHTEVTEAGEQYVMPGCTEATIPAEALVSNAPSELARTHVAPPDHAPIGHNAPPEEPMSREEMLKDFNRDIASYGKDSGRGAAALPRLGLRVIRAAADGLISTEKPKNGEKSDAVRIYEKYAEQDSKHADHTKGGMKANAAKLNALIGLGCMTTVDGVDIAQRTVDLRAKMEEADLKPKALFAGLVDVARAQMDSDTPLTDAAIEAALGKTQKEKTLADEWTAIHKKVEKLISGESPAGKDQTEAAVKIEELIREHVNNFTVDEDREEKIAFCMERGMSRAQAIEFVNK